jgi:thioredoxin 2
MSDVVQIVCPHDDAVNRVPVARLAEDPKCGKCHKPLFTGAPVELSTSRFETHVGKSDIPVVVDFWAPWCGPCRVMAPAYKEAAQLLEPRVRLARVDTESEPSLAARFDIRGIPTLVVFSRGGEVARQPGAITVAATIAAWVRTHLPAG